MNGGRRIASAWALRSKSIGRAACLLLLGIAGPGVGAAQTVFSDDFTGSASKNQWYFANGACLTAGSSTSLASPNSIPGCGTVWSSYYASSALQTIQASHGECCDAQLVGGSAGTANGGTTTGTLDPVGSGALRFTNGGAYGFYENGAIQSVTPFDASQGVQITFKTVSYRGDGGGGDGADGIGFQLMDGSLSPTSTTYNGIGSVGGSLGYSCSNTNTPYDGLVGGYLGLGIDEYGNFLNGEQLYSGYTGTNSATGDNTALGYGFKANRIGLRGAGSVSWKYLNATYPANYPTGLAAAGLSTAAVQRTCATGKVLDFSSSTVQANLAYCPLTTTNTGFAGTSSVQSGINFLVVSYSPTTFYNGEPIGGPGIPAGTTVSQWNPNGTNAYILALSVPGGGYITPTTSGAFYSPSATGYNANCPVAVTSPSPALYDYAPIKSAYVELPSNVTLANEGALARPTGLTTNGVTSGNVFLYNLKITQNGLLSLSYSVNGGSYTPVITNQSITASNGPLPATLRFGFAGSSGYYNNIHELLCFKAAPIDASASSASTDQQQVGQLQTSSQAYFSYYDPNDWTGRVTAYGLSTTSGVLGLNSTANWDSQCVLSGVSTFEPAVFACLLRRRHAGDRRSLL
jgi:type IV pilus assembly protein PilY1